MQLSHKGPIFRLGSNWELQMHFYFNFAFLCTLYKTWITLLFLTPPTPPFMAGPEWFCVLPLLGCPWAVWGCRPHTPWPERAELWGQPVCSPAHSCCHCAWLLSYSLMNIHCLDLGPRMCPCLFWLWVNYNYAPRNPFPGLQSAVLDAGWLAFLEIRSWKSGHYLNACLFTI